MNGMLTRTAHIDQARELSLLFLQAELSRIDACIRREIYCWQLAGQDINDDLRGLYVSDQEAKALSNRPFASSWGKTAKLPIEQAQFFEKERIDAQQKAEQVLIQARSAGCEPLLSHLYQVFSLDNFERDAFLVCLAPALDLRYERMYGYLQDDVTRKRPGVNLILNLLCDQGADRLIHMGYFNDDSPLFRYRLLERVTEASIPKQPVLGYTLTVDPTITAWLLGSYQPGSDYLGQVRFELPRVGWREEILSAETAQIIRQALAIQAVLVFNGTDRTMQNTAARLAAEINGEPLLEVNLAAAVQAGASTMSLVRLALRDAALTGATLYLTGWDVCLGEDQPLDEIMREIFEHPGVVILAGRGTWRLEGVDRQRGLFHIDFSIPEYAQRKNLWNHFLAGIPTEPEIDLSLIAGQFQLTASQIRDAVASAHDLANQRDGLVQEQDLFAAARLHSSPRLSNLARKIQSRYTWQDIILPPDQLSLLHEIVSTVRERPKVLDDWRVGEKLASSRGVTILFAGLPGTGKTMAAEVIAGELGLDLFKIDLSTIVSKYIGETEKNLERIFSEAETSNAILFFDEADSLFGKRSEVRDSHDRYANIEISYLLQRMEAYDGVTILATNLRANLDEAFTRRLQYAVDFPFPEEADRLRIWKTLFPQSVPQDAGIDYKMLAQRFKMAGGNIRNVIVGAAYLAASDGGVVRMGHLLHSTRRELQKMGRLVTDSDFLESLDEVDG
ncbi:MAG TPA: ATP-binding protein [Anaerolineaceae bacterium]